MTRPPNTYILEPETGIAKIEIVSKTHGTLYAVIDLADLPKVQRWKWWLRKDKSGTYARTKINGDTISLHRFLTNSPECLIDHHNSDGLDNRRRNLRVAQMLEAVC